jgi:hypothetical protein
MLRKVLCSSVALAALALATGKPLPAPIRFAIIGDRTGSHVPGVYEEIVKQVEYLRPDFAVTVGDQIEGYTGDTALLNKEWTEYHSIVGGLSMPLHLIPGNHDITTDAQLPAYEHYAGKPYYSFDYQDLHFVVLDASRWETSAELPKDQLEWLVKDLKQNRNARYTFVFFHKPYWYNTLTLGKPDTLHSIFRNNGVDAVFNGHFHLYFSGTYDNIMYTAIGSSGGEADSGPTGLQYHLTWVTVDNAGIHVAPVKVNSVLPWNELSADEAATIDRLSNTALSFERRFLLADNLKLTDSLVALQVKNSESDSLNDTLRWTIPEGWKVEPAGRYVTLAPGASGTLQFKVRSPDKQLFPVPNATLRMPYARGKTLPVTKWLSLVRQAQGKPGTPVIDGKLTESFWQNPVTRFFGPKGAPSAVESTAFLFAHDADNLYLAAWCRETKPDSIVAKAVKHDDAVYGEDCVGYFIQPDTGKGDIYQIYFNPKGVAFDQKITVTADGTTNADRAWNGTYEVKIASGADYWSMEARIPLAILGIKPDTQGLMPGTFGLNFRRKQKRLNTSADWQIPVDYNPKNFGVLLLK